jgi:hypothetical protein
MTMVAVCTDVTAPAEASAFSSCTAVAWTDSQNLGVGIFSGFTMDSALSCAGGIGVLWALAWAISRMAGLIERHGR